MKKILLGTTTLIGAAALFAGAASAETPKVTIGGFADFQVGVVGEDLDTNLRSGAFRSDTEITVRIDGKTDGGLGYGGGINLEADTSNDVDTQGTNASRTYVYLDGQWGRVQMGSDLGVSNTMKIDASSIARATGGIDGDYTYFTSGSPTYVQGSTSQVIATPDLFLDYGAGQYGNESTENLNKVSYYTPRFAGFQAGVSYLFDSNAGNRGQSAGLPALRSDDDSEAENIFVGALSYEGKFDQIGFAAAATGEWGDSEVSTVEDLRTWSVGAKVTYMGFSLAGSYGDYGDSLRTKTLNADETNYWTVGGSYEHGPFGMSVTYLDSEYDLGTGNGSNDFSNISVGVDYKLAPGFTPYAEVSFIDLDPTGTANDNDATVFIAGTQLAF